MKKNDLIFIGVAALLLAPFFVFDTVYQTYNQLNAEHGMILSFVKFAILATTGEAIGLRIKTGQYNAKGFGLIPRAIVWGFLGLTIKMAFVIFATGMPNFLAYMGMPEAIEAMKGGFTITKLITAFCISASMNLIYAPVMMTLHKVTDTHITMFDGKVSGLLKPIQFGKIFSEMNWDIQWNFVFKKTIPFFWIHAQYRCK